MLQVGTAFSQAVAEGYVPQLQAIITTMLQSNSGVQALLQIANAAISQAGCNSVQSFLISSASSMLSQGVNMSSLTSSLQSYPAVAQCVGNAFATS